MYNYKENTIINSCYVNSSVFVFETSLRPGCVALNICLGDYNRKSWEDIFMSNQSFITKVIQKHKDPQSYF